MLPYQLFIGLRYLKSKKRHRGISFNTIISIGGVAVGVMALLVVLAVMSGFHEDLQRKILGANAHAVVMSYRGEITDYDPLIARLRENPQIEALSPFVIGQAMVTSGKLAHGALVRGIDPDYETKTTDIFSHLKVGSMADLAAVDERPWIIVGRELAGHLGVITGDTINLVSPAGEIGPLGMLPRVRQFRLAAIFEMGMFEYDANLAIIDIGSARDFFGYTTGITGIQLKLRDIYAAPQVRESVTTQLGFPYFAKDWMQMNRNLFSALKLEKFAMFVILILIVLVASFNIVSTLMMSVIEKEKEIAILKALGATNRGIMTVFILQGLLIGVIGTAIGVAGAYVLGNILNDYEVIKLPADVYYLSKLPVKMKFLDFLIVSCSAVVISFLSTLYPSYQAARLKPIEALRYE